ncbi:MAG TPA: nuclear transport factor 2 family protein [Terriglobales bacterium]|nr:nuclear transport factor 2 family protein [Terriglobales bacterium]
MRRAPILLFALFCSIPLFAQSPSNVLQSELQALHAKWFKAYDSGDGVTMDQMEMKNLVLVMPTGELWKKTKPRGTDEPKLDPQAKHTLRDVSVRQFGDAAILTGTLTNESKAEKTVEATTVVFVRSSGQWKIASAQWTDLGKTK